MRPYLVLVALAACGRLGFTTVDGDEGDGGTRDGGTITGRHWVNRNDGGPGKIHQPKMVYDSARRSVILYGGHKDGQAANDATAAMWELTSAGWQQLCDPCAPGRRFLHALGYDPVRDRVVMSGGRDSSNALHGGIWEWDGAVWSNITENGAIPAPREGASFVFDAATQKLIMVGGDTGAAAIAETHAWDGSTWSTITISAAPAPNACYGACTTTSGGRTFALIDDLFGTSYDDLWSTDGTTWSQDCAACSGRPRSHASIVGDPALSTLYLVGGFDNPGMAEIEGTWKYTPQGWSMISTLPPARDSVGVVYDVARETIVVYGGNGAPCGGNCAETWEFVPE